MEPQLYNYQDVLQLNTSKSVTLHQYTSWQYQLRRVRSGDFNWELGQAGDV